MSQHGQSMVEFALSSVVLLLLVGGLVDIGRAIYINEALGNSAREGARHGVYFDPATRTLQVEIRIPNDDGSLFAGAYVQARLPIKGNRAATVVPTNVLLFRPDGPRVAVVDDGGHVRLAPVKLGTDFGTSVEIVSGLDGADHIVINPADSLSDGDNVTVMPHPGSG